MPVGVAVAVLVGVAVAVGVAVDVAVAVGVLLGVGVWVGVADGVGLGVGVGGIWSGVKTAVNVISPPNITASNGLVSPGSSVQPINT